MFHKIPGIVWLAEDLLASQEGLCSMELSYTYIHSHKPLSIVYRLFELLCVCVCVCVCFKLVNMLKMQNSEAVVESMYAMEMGRHSRQSM